MLAILTFLASGPGGALLGLIINIVERKRELDKQRSDKALNEYLASHKQLEAHAQSLDKAAASVVRTTKRKINLLGLSWESEFPKVYTLHRPTYRARIVAFCLLCLCLAYCAVFVLFALDPAWVLYSLDPDRSPSRINLLIFSWEWTRTQPVVLNAGGAAFYMASAVNFILSAAIVGVGGKLAR